MSNRALPALLSATLALTPGVLPAQVPVELARGGPQPHFVAAWAPDREREAERSATLAGRVSLDLQDVSLDEALKALTNEAGLNITYSLAVLPPGKHVTLEAGDIAVITALTEILFRSGLDVVVDQDGTLALIRCKHLIPTAEIQDSGTIVGTVTDKATAAPLAGATVVLEGTRRSATTNSEGGYQLAKVKAGTYTARARYIGYALLSTSVTVIAGEEVKADFALERSVQVLDEVVTTGTLIPTEVKALPTPLTVIGADEIADRHPQSLADVVRQTVPTAVAFDVPTQPVQTSFAVRGANSLGASQMKIFVDGVEAANFGLSPVDLNSIDRIEIARGPQVGALYGADAAGGVMQIFTKRGSQAWTRPKLDAKVELGMLQTPYDGFEGVLRQDYSGSVRGGGPGVSYNLGGGYTNLADYVPEGEISRQSTPTVYGGMNFERGIFTADLSARYYLSKLPFVLNPLALTTGFIPTSRPNYTMIDFSNETYGARATLSPVSWWRNEVTVGLDRSNSQQQQLQRRFTTPDDTLFFVGNGSIRKISARFNTSAMARLSDGIAGSFTLGVDHYDQDAANSFTTQAVNTSGTIVTSPPGAFFQSSSTTRNTGYFGQVQMNVREALFFTGALRLEDNSSFGPEVGTAVLPRVGLSLVRPLGQATLKVRGSYGEAIRAPGAGLAFGGSDGFTTTLPNPGLKPEQQLGWDAGIDLVFGQRGSLSVTGFDQKARDLIAFVFVSATPGPTFQWQNIGEVSNQGVELEGALTVHPLRLTAQYGYVKSRIEELGAAGSAGDLRVGDQPLAAPRHTGGAALTLSVREGTTLSTGITYVGSYRNYDGLLVFGCLGGTQPCPDSFVNSGFTDTRDFIIDYPDFAKVNATLTQRITQQLVGILSVDNLTNNQSYEFSNTDPVTGRLTTLGLQLEY